VEEDKIMDRDIYITEFDVKRLTQLLQEGLSFTSRDTQHLESLQKELERAHIVEPQAVPRDIVTMNSRVRLKDLNSGDERIYTLVFPTEADVTQNKISILAPVGTAMLGYRVGDKIDWPVPSGMKTFRIEEILYQPEAAGDFHL
jgi:regulator of nucleoside diphosphate kinase